MDAKLQSIASLQNDSEKVVRYTELLREISIDASDEKSLVEQFVAHLLSVPSISPPTMKRPSAGLEGPFAVPDDWRIIWTIVKCTSKEFPMLAPGQKDELSLITI